MFDIDSGSGAIAVQNDADLDHEDTSSYTATVTATDSNNATATHEVTISVTDVDEPPAAPDAPSVAGASTTSVTVTWTAPDTAGKPAVSDYDVRWRASGDTDWFDASHEGTTTSTTLSSLNPGATYEAQVRATNAEGASGWSETGSGATNPNNAPAFTNQPTTASVAENSPGGTAVVTIAATDADGDTLSYSLDSASDAVFDIDSGSGAIAVQNDADLDHEDTSSYTATVTATDSNNATATHEVTISVTDVDEPPAAPDAPSVAGASTTSVTVTWTAPDTAGKPAVSDYDVRWRASGDTDWFDASHEGTTTSTTLSSLNPGATYEAQVRATNAEGASGWSETGSGATNPNNAPAFTNQPTTASVAENSPGGTAVVTIAATDADGDTLSYSLDSASDAVFDIDSGSGAIAVQNDADLDHEDTSSYTATVTATDSNNATATHEVTISVTDVDEPPDAPSAPSVIGASTTTITVRWTAPETVGKPPISDFDVRYRASGDDAWIDASFDGTTPIARISGLAADTAYEAQVRANNDEGSSAWSAAGSGSTDSPANVAPPPAAGLASGSTVTFEFGETLDTRSVPAPEDFTVTLAGAVAQASVQAASPVRPAQIQAHRVTAVSIEGSTLALTVTPPVPAGQSVTVSYTRGTTPLRTADGQKVQEFTQTVSDTRPPGAPTGVAVTTDSPTSLEVTWTAPRDPGTGLAGYGVQYRATAETRWTDHPHPDTATQTVIGNLQASTSYHVRVRSLGDGDSDWTAAEGRTAVAAPAVTDALPDLTLVAGAAAVEVDAGAVFAGQELAFVYTSSNRAVASFDGSDSVTLNAGKAARLQGESAGEARIEVTASNASGSASVTFAVTVKAISDEEAEALGLSLDGLSRTLLSSATGVIGARLAASQTAAPSLQSLTGADARAALAGLFDLPAPAPGTVVAGYGPAANGGRAFEASLAPNGLLRSRSDLQSGSGTSGIASGGLWNRSFAFSIGPGSKQTLDSAPAVGGRQSLALGLAQLQEGGPTSDDGQSSDGARVPGSAPALPRWTVWGAGDVQRFSSGGEGEQRYEGDWRTAYLGVDGRMGERWLGGVAFSAGEGQADYQFGGAHAGDGRLQTDLTAVYPYIKGVFERGNELWIMLGAGTGEAMNLRGPEQRITHEGDLRMSLAAAGLRSAIVESGTIRLSVLADVGTVTLDIEGEQSLADLQSRAHRARVGMELSGKGAWSPYLQLSGRFDGGENMAVSETDYDVEAGYEAEVGLRRSGARVDFELRGRWMARSGDADYEESGATAVLRIKSAPDGTGLTASLTPAWGRPGGTDLVWSQGPMPVMQPWAGAETDMTLRAELGYGIESYRLRGLLTPLLGYERGAPGNDRLRFGADYTAKPEWLPAQLSIGFGLQRQQTMEGPAWGAELRMQMRW